jgi:hypothetical protein
LHEVGGVRVHGECGRGQQNPDGRHEGHYRDCRADDLWQAGQNLVTRGSSWGTGFKTSRDWHLSHPKGTFLGGQSFT